jgi:hypothetical protein
MIDELIDLMNAQRHQYKKPIEVVLITDEQRMAIKAEAKPFLHVYVTGNGLEYLNGALLTVPRLKGGSHPCTTLDFRPEAERGQMIRYMSYASHLSRQQRK